MLSLFSLISLRSKILVGMMLSLVPMLAITAITYYSGRNATLGHSERIMTLVTQHRADEINAFLARQQNQFLDWAGNDVFGMAIEFQTISELGHHFTSMLEGQDGISVLVLTDIQGRVLTAVANGDTEGLARKALEGQQIDDVTGLMQQAERFAALIEHRFVDLPKFSSKSTYLLMATVKDSANRPNGYLLAYLNWSFLQEIVVALANDNRANGFPTARVLIQDLDSDTVLGHSDPAKIDTPLDPEAVLKKWLLQSGGGSVRKVKGDAGTEYVAAVPLKIVSGALSRSQGGGLDFPLFLTCFVPENDIVADVQKNLRTSILIGAAGGVVIIFIALFFLADVKGKFNKFLKVFEAMSQGNIKGKLAIAGRDEFADAAVSFNRLVGYLQEVLQVCEGVAVGNYDRTIEKSSSDDLLSDAISRMTTTLKEVTSKQEEQNWFKTGQAELNDRMRGEQDVDALARNTITFLAEYLHAQVGAIYLSESDNTLSLKGTYALTRRKHLNNKFEIGEGLVGQCALERKEILVTNLPENYLPVHSGTGNATPANILVMPFIYEDQVKGVIELGAFSSFVDRQIDFLKDSIESIAINFNTAQARNRMSELLTQTQNQAAAMQKQQEKMRASNKELEEQTRLLKESEERLQVQQAELRQTNEELVEKSTILEDQKADIERKNVKLKQAQLEIEQKAKDLELSGKYKSEFLANMSHELRTPLNSLLILSDLLCKNKKGNLDEKQVNYSRTIHSSAMDLLNLINEILDLSKIEAGKMTLSIQSLALTDLKSDIVNTFDPVAKEKKIAFSVVIGDRAPATLQTDGQRLSQILKNLLSNALKFTQQGSVCLTIDRPADDAALSDLNAPLEQIVAFHVADTGKGIKEDQQKFIFEAFQQEDGSTSRKYGGTGLGLSISRELTKLMGGLIKLHSVEGRGTTFSVYLPQSAVQVQDAEKASEPEPDKPADPADGATNGHGESVAGPAEPDSGREEFRDDRHYLQPDDRKLLIIEDDASFADILMDMGREKDFKCLLAMDGEAGLYMVEHYRPDAVILDIGLPGMSGLDVLKRVKENLDTRHIPVHCISVADQASQAAQMGAMGYLVKPAKMEDLEKVFTKFEGMLEKKIRQLLVVEDDANQRQAIEELLGGDGTTVTTAETGGQAYELLQSEAFDCMILDLGLPDMTGIELLQKFKADEAIDFIPTIVFTGQELSRQEETELALYVQSIILKGSEKSEERLLDETCLFLHMVENDLSSDKRQVIEKIHDKDHNFKNKKILLVDDDMRNVFALTEMLEGKQLQVLAAKNGREALKQLEQHADIGLVLMDIMMPEMDGFEAMGAIRAQERFARLPIIALTAKAMRGDRRKCIEAGATEYLPKPVDAHRLESLLKVWLCA